MWNKLLIFGYTHGYLEYETDDPNLLGMNDGMDTQSESIIEEMRLLRERMREESDSEAQRIVNRALAHYCEHCDRAFSDTGACKMHKRFKHKPL